MAVAERQRGKEAAYSIGENYKTANLNVFEENLPSFPTLSTNLRGAMKKTKKVSTTQYNFYTASARQNCN